MEPALRVLCIEDSEDDFRLLTRLLGREFGAFESARVESRDALEAALRGPPWDVVLSDQRGTGLDIADTLAILARHQSSAPVILVSGAADPAGAPAGVLDVVAKSELDRLPDVVRRARAARAPDPGTLHAAAAAGAALARDLEDLAVIVDGYGRLARAALSPLHPARRHLARARGRAAGLRQQVRRLVVAPGETEPPQGLAEVVERAAQRLRLGVRRAEAVTASCPEDLPPLPVDLESVEHALRILVDGVGPALRDAASVRCLAERPEGASLALGLDATGDFRLDRLHPGWLDADPLVAAVARDAPLGLAALRWLCADLDASLSFLHDQPAHVAWRLTWAAPTAANREPGPYGTELLLAVHGDVVARRRLKLALAAYGYRVLGASDARDAARALARCGDRLAMLVFDLDDAAGAAAARDPELAAASGTRPWLCVASAATESGAPAGAVVCRPPVPPRTLAWQIRRLLHAAREATDEAVRRDAR